MDMDQDMDLQEWTEELEEIVLEAGTRQRATDESMLLFNEQLKANSEVIKGQGQRIGEQGQSLDQLGKSSQEQRQLIEAQGQRIQRLEAALSRDPTRRPSGVVVHPLTMAAEKKAWIVSNRVGRELLEEQRAWKRKHDSELETTQLVDETSPNESQPTAEGGRGNKRFRPAQQPPQPRRRN